MQIPNFTLLLALSVSLFAPAAMAENPFVPDKEHRQGMSYEEYTHYREKMRMHMEKMGPEGSRHMPTPPGSPAEQAERSDHNSAYGQGYRSRNQADGKPDTTSRNRPDRPRVERFNRGDMGRR